MIAASTEHAVKEFRRLVREINADRAAVQERYDIACEIIANHLEGGNGSTDRAREMVEGQYRLRHGPVEGQTS